MVKNHLIRLAAPRTWQIPRKITKFIGRPSPGAHSFVYGMPLVVVLRDIIKVADTTRQVRHILNNKEVQVNGKIIRKPRTIVGFMDVLSIPRLNLFFRISLNKKNQLVFVETDGKDAKLRLAKISGKRTLKGNNQAINLNNGQNIIVKDRYRVGDSIVIDNDTGAATKRLELKKGVPVMLTGGRHIGAIGKIVEIIPKKLYGDQIVVKTKDEQFTTLRRFAFVLGETEPLVKIEK